MITFDGLLHRAKISKLTRLCNRHRCILSTPAYTKHTSYIVYPKIVHTIGIIFHFPNVIVCHGVGNSTLESKADAASKLQVEVDKIVLERNNRYSTGACTYRGGSYVNRGYESDTLSLINQLE